MNDQWLFGGLPFPSNSNLRHLDSCLEFTTVPWSNQNTNPIQTLLESLGRSANLLSNTLVLDLYCTVHNAHQNSNLWFQPQAPKIYLVDHAGNSWISNKMRSQVWNDYVPNTSQYIVKRLFSINLDIRTDGCLIWAWWVMKEHNRVSRSSLWYIK